MHPMKQDADRARSAKRSRMGVSDQSTGNSTAAYAPSAVAPTWPERTDMTRTSVAGERPTDDIDGAPASRKADRPARRAYATGGAVKNGKGKTSINIVIAPQGGGNGGPTPMPAPPVGAAPIPAPPPLGPPPMGAGAPPMSPPNLAGGAPLPMRKRGGRVKLDAGAGSGLGRIEKQQAQKRKS